MRKECEDSLRRLKLDVIDLYQVHWPQPDEEIEEGWTEMARLQQEGKVRWIGVSNFNIEQMKRAQKIAPITSLQPPYSLLAREVEAEILPFCRQNGIGVIVYSPMRAGLLTGKMTKERAQNLPEDDWRRRNPDFQEPKLSRNLQLVEILRRYRGETRTHSGRSCPGMDTEQSGCYCSDCGPSPCGSGQWHHWCSQLPLDGRRSRRN